MAVTAQCLRCPWKVSMFSLDGPDMPCHRCSLQGEAAIAASHTWLAALEGRFCVCKYGVNSPAATIVP